MCPWLCGFAKCVVPDSVLSIQARDGSFWVMANQAVGTRLFPVDPEDGGAQEGFLSLEHSSAQGLLVTLDTGATPVPQKEPYFTQDGACFSDSGRSRTFHSFMTCLKGLTALGQFKVPASLHTVTSRPGSMGLRWDAFHVLSLQWG